MMRLVAIAILLILSACSKGPGPLEGTWKMTGVIPVTVTFREAEEESMGLISKVSYEHDDNDVLVTYNSGISEGTTLRVTMTGPNTAVIEGMGKLSRIR